MKSRLLHIYGPLWVNSYGLMILIGILAFMFLSIGHPLRKKIISKQLYLDTIFWGILVAVIGGRILFILESWSAFDDNWLEAFYPWVGGLSSLGCVLAVILFAWFYLRKHGVPFLPFMDLITMHAPLVYAFGRIGCFLAGCCHGRVTDSILSIVYTDPHSLAPLHVKLIPMQLYESLAGFVIFFILRFVIPKYFSKPGNILGAYLFFTGLERFFVDFWRGDWEPFTTVYLIQLLSFSQIIAISISAIGFFVWYLTRK